MKTLKRNCKFCKNKLPDWARSNAIYCSDICKGKSKYSKRKVDKEWFRLRFEVLIRDEFKCVYCGRSPQKDNITLHVDHLQPISKGGKNELLNLVTSCEECNIGKSDQLIPEELKPKI